MPGPESGHGSPFCFLCGDRALADFFLNILLFAPLGAALAGSGWSVTRGTLLGGGMSIAVESAQWFIPGRFSSIDDVVANTLGTLAGLVFWRLLPTLLAPVPTARRRLLAGAVAGVMVAQLVVLPLSRFSLPERGYYTQVTPRLGGYGRFSGMISSVRVGSTSIWYGRLPWDLSVRDSLLAGQPLEIRGTAGYGVDSLAPLVNVVDLHHDFDISVIQDGHDFRFRYRSLGEAIGLTPIELRVDDGLGALAEGQPLVVTMTHRAFSWCFVLPRRAGCRALGPGGLWRYLAGGIEGGLGWLDAAWLALLFVPLGYWSRGRSAVVAPVLGLLPMPIFLVLVGPATLLAGFAGALAGMTAGHLARVALARHSLRWGTDPA